MSKILEPNELDPSLMRHACIAAIGYLTGASILEKDGMIATLREAVTTPAKRKDHYDPPGIEFFDMASGRQMKLVADGIWKGWIAYKHPDGQWVSLRKAEADDLAKFLATEAQL